VGCYTAVDGAEEGDIAIPSTLIIRVGDLKGRLESLAMDEGVVAALSSIVPGVGD
jgi:hypothetical protein